MFDSAVASGLSATSYQLAGGRAGTIQTAQAMRSLVRDYRRNPEIRALAMSLVGFLDQKDHAGEVNALFLYVRDSIRYLQDIYEVETLQTPDKTIQLAQGDCDDKATLLATLLESIGFRTVFKLTGYHGSEFEHVYLYVEGPGVSLHLDATEPEPAGFEPPNPTVSLYVE